MVRSGRGFNSTAVPGIVAFKTDTYCRGSQGGSDSEKQTIRRRNARVKGLYQSASCEPKSMMNVRFVGFGGL